MDFLVGKNQCSFVSERNSYDNVIIAQEIIHSMERKKGRKGLMVVKVDLEKVYDRIRWDFLKDTLKAIGLNHHWVKLIMCCVSSTKMKVIWNEQHSDEFVMERGIRQSDPLSPYLFVLCMERLSHLIDISVATGEWKSIRLSRNGPKISHLFFVDDLFLF